MPTTTTTMSATTKAAAGRACKFFQKTDAEYLQQARDYRHLVTTWGSPRKVSAYLRENVKEQPKDAPKPHSHVTIQRYINVLDSLPKDVTAAVFATALRGATTKARNAGTPKDDEGVTPGNAEPTVTTPKADTIESLIAEFDALSKRADALPARDRQRFVAHVTRTVARRYTKAA